MCVLYVVLNCTISPTVILQVFSHLSAIETLIGLNCKKCMHDMNWPQSSWTLICISQKWELHNHLNLMIIKDLFQILAIVVFQVVNWGISQCDRVRIQRVRESKIGNLLNRFTNTLYNNTRDFENYILRIVQLATRLREINIPVTDDFVDNKFLTPCKWSMSS